VTHDERDQIRRYVERLDRRRATLADELADEVAQVKDLTMRDRGDWIAAVCRSAWSILRSRGDRADALLRRDEPAGDYAAIWRKLAARRQPTEPPA
jgi:hypothetical protein